MTNRNVTNFNFFISGDLFICICHFFMHKISGFHCDEKPAETEILRMALEQMFYS